MCSPILAAAAAPRANEGTDLAPSFSESFADAWANGRPATSAIRQQNARTQAVSEYTDQIKAAGGDVDGEYARQLAMGGSVTTSDGSAGGGPDPLEVANGVVARMKASADAAGRSSPLRPCRRTTSTTEPSRSRRGRLPLTALWRRDRKTWSSWLGGVAGGLSSFADDPFNIPMLAIAPEGAVAKVAAFAGANMLTQTANEAVNSNFNEKVQPGYAASGQALGNIVEAGVSGAEMAAGGEALGFGIQGARQGSTRLSSGAWPTAAKDAANGVMSEADILNSNTHTPIEPTLPEVRAVETPPAAPRAETPAIMEPGAPAVAPSIPERTIGAGEQILPGAEGEAAHNAAIGKAIDDVLKGNPVDVSDAIPPGSDFERRIGDLPSDYGTTAPISEGEPAEPAPFRPVSGPDDLQASLATPEAMNAARADVERAIDEAAQKGEALRVPIGWEWQKNSDGSLAMDGLFPSPVYSPIFGNVADHLAEIDKMNELAAQILECATPAALQMAAE